MKNIFNRYFIKPLPTDSFEKKAMVETVIFTGVLGLIFTFVGVYYSKAGLEEELLRYTREDGWVEWLQFLLFFSTSMFALYAHYYFRKVNGLKWMSWATVGMMAVVGAFLFGAMEEISWAQRLVGRESSELFLTMNKQGETNLHNLEIRGVSVNKLVFGKILFLVVLFHNLVLPIWAEHKKSVSDWATVKMGGFFPPLIMIGFYIAGAIGAEMIDHTRRKEMIELTGAIHYFTAVFLAYGLGFKVRGNIFKGVSALYASRAFMGFIILMIGLAWMLSVTVRTAPL